jgi:hypothetical protein
VLLNASEIGDDVVHAELISVASKLRAVIARLKGA